MLKSEFEQMIGRTVTNNAYDAIEKLYMASTLNKNEFIKNIKGIIKTIPTQEQENIVTIAVSKMPNGTWATYQAKVVDIDIATGKVLVKRLSDTHYWAEISYDYHKSMVEEIGKKRI